MKPIFQIETGAYLVAALSIVLIPASWLMAWCLAVVIHELFHYLALRLFRIPVYQICIGPSGVMMQTEEGSDLQMCICALAGPLSGIFLLQLMHTAPKVALCSVFLSFYNLIPIHPFDGGRALSGLVRHIFPGKYAERIITAVEHLTLLLLLGASVYAATALNLGYIPFLCVLILLLRNKKYLANIVNKRYNSGNKKARGLDYESVNTAYFTDGTKTCKIYRRRI